MSQPRRRRRRRKRGGGGQPRGDAPKNDAQQQSGGRSTSASSGPKRRRRRRRRPGGPGRGERPKTLEQVIEEASGRITEPQMSEPDGTTLEEVIGDLQSSYGVPQYPQEFRITIKVAEERSRNGGSSRSQPQPAVVTPAAGSGGVTREKAPAAPRVGASGEDQAAPRKRRRRGRRRRSKGSGSGGGGGPTGK